MCETIIAIHAFRTLTPGQARCSRDHDLVAEAYLSQFLCLTDQQLLLLAKTSHDGSDGSVPIPVSTIVRSISEHYARSDVAWQQGPYARYHSCSSSLLRVRTLLSHYPQFNAKLQRK